MSDESDLFTRAIQQRLPQKHIELMAGEAVRAARLNGLGANLTVNAAELLALCGADQALRVHERAAASE